MHIADTPVLGDGVRLAGLHTFLSGQGSTAAGAEQLADIPSSGGPHGFLPGQVSTASPGPVHVNEHLPDSAEWVQCHDAATGKPVFTGTDASLRLSGCHRLASRSSGSARGLRREGSTTGSFDLPPLPPE